MARGHNVIRFLMPMLIFLSYTICNAQGRIAPQFIPDKNKSSEAYPKITGFLGDLNDSTIQSMPKCFGGIGYFSFIIKSNGDVELQNYEGHLPLRVVDNIKKNILNTSGKWISEIEYGEYVNSKRLIYIFFVKLDRYDDCNSSNPLYRKNEVELGYTLQLNINNTKQNMIISDNNYLLPVGCYMVIE